jgi:hypothetical protein
VLINVCVQEMSTQTWFAFAELKVDLDLGQCSCSLVPTTKLKCGVLLSGSSLANRSDMNFHWTSSAASENNFMKRWDWWIAWVPSIPEVAMHSMRVSWRKKLMLECSLYASVDAASGDSKNRGAAGLLWRRPTNASSPFDFLCHISKDH